MVALAQAEWLSVVAAPRECRLVALALVESLLVARAPVAGYMRVVVEVYTVAQPVQMAG